MGLKSAVLFSLFGAAAAGRSTPAEGRSLLQMGPLPGMSAWTTHEMAGDNAKCLNGQSGVFYTKEARGSRDWFVFFQGTQFCTSLDDCDAQAMSSIQATGRIDGNVVSYEDYQHADGNGYQASIAFEEFSNMNLMYVIGCDKSGGTSTSGHVDGHHAFHGGAAMVDEAIMHVNMQMPRDVLFASASQAHTAVINADAIAAGLSGATTVAAWQDGGFVTDGLTTDAVLTDMFDHWGSRVNTDCHSHHMMDGWRCLLGPVAAQHTKTPVFFSGSKYDVFVPYHRDRSADDAPAFGDIKSCINDPAADRQPGCASDRAFRDSYADQMMHVASALPMQHGYYLGNCIAHAWSGVSGLVGQRFHNTLVSKHTLRDAVGLFFASAQKGDGAPRFADTSKSYTPSGDNSCEASPRCCTDAGHCDSNNNYVLSAKSHSPPCPMEH